MRSTASSEHPNDTHHDSLLCSWAHRYVRDGPPPAKTPGVKGRRRDPERGVAGTAQRQNPGKPNVANNGAASVPTLERPARWYVAPSHHLRLSRPLVSYQRR